VHAQEYRTWHGKAAAAKKGKDRRWMTGETGSFGERGRGVIGWLLYRGRERGNPWHLMVSERIEAKRVDGDKTLDSTIMKYLRLENDIRKEK